MSSLRSTTVEAEREVRSRFSATIAATERFFNQHAGRIRVGPLRHVRVRVEPIYREVRDPTDQTRIHEALAISWYASWPLPDYHGLVTVRPNGPTTCVRISGAYRPPLGWAGMAFDRIAGRRLALATLRRLLEEIDAFIAYERENDR